MPTFAATYRPWTDSPSRAIIVPNRIGVVAFIEPPQGEVIERILRHCGLWHCSRAPPADGDFVHDPDAASQSDSDEPRELTFVADDAIWAEADAFASIGPPGNFQNSTWKPDALGHGCLRRVLGRRFHGDASPLP